MPFNEALLMKAMFAVHELWIKKALTANLIHWPNLNHVSHAAYT